MKLTPLDIHHKEFRRSIRGYNEEEVDVFLDQVAEEFERVFKENIELKEQIDGMKDKVVKYEGVEQTLQKALFTAQQAADEVQNSAKKESDLIIKDAELKAKEIIQNILNEKQALQGELQNLRGAEKDFRDKFRTFLNHYLKIVNKVDQEEKPAPPAETVAAESISAPEPQPAPEPEPAPEPQPAPEPFLGSPSESQGQPVSEAPVEPAARQARENEGEAPREEERTSAAPLYEEPQTDFQTPEFGLGQPPAADTPRPREDWSAPPEEAKAEPSEAAATDEDFRVTFGGQQAQRADAETPAAEEQKSDANQDKKESHFPNMPDVVSSFFDDDVGGVDEDEKKRDNE